MSRGTIIFDFDGTIANSFDAALDFFYQLTGRDQLTDNEIAELRCLPARKVIKHLGIPLRQVPGLLVKGRAWMHQRMHDIAVFDGVPATLKQLHEDNWQLMVMSSNSRQNVDVYLRKHGLREYFDRIYGNVGLFSKTQSLRKVLRQNRLERGACFYVGDEVRDMQAAARIRVRGVAVSWGYNDPSTLKDQRPFALARSPADLPKIFADVASDRTND